MKRFVAVFSITLGIASNPFVVADGPRNFVGRASCASATCHGGVIERGPVWNHALSLWDAYDPHAGAGLLLRDDDSKTIVDALDPEAIDDSGVINRDHYDSVLRKRCISCHTMATQQQCAGVGALDEMVLARGVSCEACHGASENWLHAHTGISWKGPQRFEQETGMLDTESIIGRAEGCVRCHVGSRRADGLVRDMNHDLIAAGHPALRFDLLLYNENLPKHWNVDGAVEKSFDQSAVTVRAVSRAISLSNAAALSSERATDHLTDRNVPWPELSDYDCFACHQSLSMAEYQLPASEKRRSPQSISDGVPMWNAWHTINQQPIGKASLEKLSPNLSDPKAIIPVGQTLKRNYEKKATDHLAVSPDAQQSLDRSVKQLTAGAPLDWHQAAIQYLDIDAALRDLERAGSSPTTALEFRVQVEPLLRFVGESGRDGETKLDSPKRFNSEQFQQTVLRMLTRSDNAPPSTNN